MNAQSSQLDLLANTTFSYMFLVFVSCDDILTTTLFDLYIYFSFSYGFAQKAAHDFKIFYKLTTNSKRCPDEDPFLISQG